MIWLLSCVASTVAFVHTMRLGQHLKGNMAWIGAINYAAASLGCGIWWVLRPGTPFGGKEVGFGVLVGLGLVGAYFVINANIRITGVGVTNTVERLSAIAIPVFGTMCLWGELPELATQWVGLVLVFVSLPLLARGGGPVRKDASRWKAAILLAALFILPGYTSLAFTGYERVSGPDPQPAFFTVMFTVAAIANVAAAAASGRPRTKDVLLGVLLGAINLVSNFLFYKAIATLDSIVVFPTLAAGVILVSSGVAVVIWKERYAARVLVGMAIAAIALVLINFRTEAENGHGPDDQVEIVRRGAELQKGRLGIAREDP